METNQTITNETNPCIETVETTVETTIENHAPVSETPTAPTPASDEELKTFITTRLKQLISEAVSNAYRKGHDDALDEETARLGILENFAGTKPRNTDEKTNDTPVLNNIRPSIWDL